MRELLAPNKNPPPSAMRTLALAQAGVLLAAWIVSPFVFLPTPMEVLSSMGDLWHEGLGAELVASLQLNLEAILVSTLLSLLLAYSTVVPFFRPLVDLLSKLRFLSLVGLTFFFTLLAGTGHELKLSLLVFSTSVFFVTGMADVVASAPREKFDLARTLGMSEWRAVWEVVVLGQAHQGLDVLRQNAAVGWMMLTMVEGMSRSEGGVGALLLNQNRHFHLAAVLGIQLTMLGLGLVQDRSLGSLRSFVCPYADLTTERR